MALISALALAVGGCGQAADQKLLAISEDMADSSMDCWRTVRSGSRLLSTEACTDFASKNEMFNEIYLELEENYENSLDFKIRNFINLEREVGYFPCNQKCWEARANAQGAIHWFELAIQSDIGCDFGWPRHVYYLTKNPDDLDRLRDKPPCDPTSEVIE